jgi:hypothetical protein
MISELKKVNSIIDLSRQNGLVFNEIKVSFKSYSKDNILKVADILKQDKIQTILNRSFFCNKLICEIDIIDKFYELEYQKIVGKFSLLASKCYVKIEIMGVV